ncbi:type II secretion system F family protein [Hydrogenophaga sp.]|uniref:type II secretion system F family protein n=1 Tax=Hydrogenophaga sp. TaxID=1904254 RepID=UPI0025BE3D95|nr:type II secretion system F family protein [Hydrogenophaga sp.]
MVRCTRPGDASVTEARRQAGSLEALRETLLHEGWIVLDVRLLGVARGSSNSRQALGRTAYAVFCRELTTLLRAGMSVVEAVDTLAARQRVEAQPRRMVSPAPMLLQHLSHGLPLSRALGMLPDTPGVLVAAVRAGERTSDLVQALQDYLRFDELVERLRKRVVSAAIYPAMVTALGLGISLFLLLVVMPSFSRMYAGLQGGATGSGNAMVLLSVWIKAHQGAAFATLALAVVLIAWWVWRGGARRALDAAIEGVPWLRVRVRDFRLAMMYQTLALMLSGGYAMVDALRVARDAALDRRLREGLDACMAQVEQGKGVAESLALQGLCDEVGRRLMAAAERNGAFPRAAAVVADLHGERFELFIERMTRVVEPVLLLAVALMVGAIVVTMYLPVFDMATRLR